MGRRLQRVPVRILLNDQENQIDCRSDIFYI